MFENYAEKQKISETLDAILKPLIPFMSEKAQIRLERAMELIHSIPIESEG